MKFQAHFNTFIGEGTFNKIPHLYDKISITIATKLYRKISPVCHLWHCYSCFTLTTIPRQQTRDIFQYSFVLW